MTETASVRSRLLRPLVAAAVALLLVLGFWYFRSPETTMIKAGMAAPDLELTSGSLGRKGRLSSFRGKPVLLVFFMSSCHICATELPQVERLYRELRTRGLVVLGVSVDADYTTRETFLRETGITFGVMQDPNGEAIRQAYGSYKMPEAYLIDPQGQVAAVYVGSVNWRGPEVREQIEKLLPPPPRDPRPLPRRPPG